MAAVRERFMRANGISEIPRVPVDVRSPVGELLVIPVVEWIPIQATTLPGGDAVTQADNRWLAARETGVSRRGPDACRQQRCRDRHDSES